MKKVWFQYYLKYSWILFFLSLLIFQCQNRDNRNSEAPSDKSGHHQGLVGAWYHSDDLTRIGTSRRIQSLDQTWDAITGRGNDWSAQWEGFITSPVTGEVTLYSESNREFIIEIGDNVLVHVKEGANTGSGTIEMVKDKKYPIRIIYLQHTGGEAYFKAYWSWANQEKKIIPPAALTFSDEQAKWWNYTEKPNPEDFDFSSLKTIPVENYFAYYEPGRFAGWPANNGVWIWGNEILVGFEKGYHNPNPDGGHAIRGDKPSFKVLARSLDGGETWALEHPKNFVDSEIDEPEKYKLSPGVNFTHPDFAMRIGGDRYFVTYDRGKTWEGPYRVNLKENDEIKGRLTSRTDYIVLGPKECLVFISAETGLVESNYQDRSLCLRTTDGGKTFEFLGWMTHNTEVRSVMSSTVYVDDQHLVSVMRRKHEQKIEKRPVIIKNWIEVAESVDNGKTWTNLGKVADTDDGERNGNPPAMVKLADGRLCVVYGYRTFPYGMRIKVSNDKGKIWGEEIVLRSDGATWDLGYPRMVVRPDGKPVVIYYYTTEERVEQHIGVTIFDPKDIK